MNILLSSWAQRDKYLYFLQHENEKANIFRSLKSASKELEIAPSAAAMNEYVLYNVSLSRVSSSQLLAPVSILPEATNLLVTATSASQSLEK